MNQLFNNINEFIQSKQNCVFCKSQLVPVLSNMFELPLINSKVIDGMFAFDINYTSATIDVNTTGVINIKTNELMFVIPPVSENCTELNYAQLVNVFEELKTHVQLRCNNRDCGMNYYCCSNVFKCEPASNQFGGHYHNFSNYTRIKPFLTYYESCNIDKYWVQNDIIYGKTRIISTTNPDSDPITVSPINFESLGKDKLKMRVLTIVTFF